VNAGSVSAAAGSGAGPAVVTTRGTLWGVAATSAGKAWAVGQAGTKTLILHWNGSTWKQVPSPGPAASNALQGVATSSARNAWAVGLGQVLILRWNGTSWK
jgi:hypothetical protein